MIPSFFLNAGMDSSSVITGFDVFGSMTTILLVIGIVLIAIGALSHMGHMGHISIRCKKCGRIEKVRGVAFKFMGKECDECDGEMEEIPGQAKHKVNKLEKAYTENTLDHLSTTEIKDDLDK